MSYEKSLTVGLIKRISLYKITYFLEPYTLSKSKVKAELDLPNYATKSDLKNATNLPKNLDLIHWNQILTNYILINYKLPRLI